MEIGKWATGLHGANTYSPRRETKGRVAGWSNMLKKEYNILSSSSGTCREKIPKGDFMASLNSPRVQDKGRVRLCYISKDFRG